MIRRGSVVLAVTACALALGCAYLWRELGQERARNAELRARLETSARSAAAVQTVKTDAPPPAGVSPTTADASPPPEIAPLSRHVTGTQEEWESTQRRLMQDPRYREVQREQGRLALAPRRANLIRLLGLTPEQADAVIDLQIERQWQQGNMLNDPAGNAEAQEKSYQSRLHDMLGAEKQAQLQHYMESRQTRMQVDTFRTQLSGIDTLRDDQVEPLIEALHAERSQYQEQLEQYRETLDSNSDDSWQRFAERQAELMKEMHAAMHSSASAILSTSQLQQLDAMLARQLQRHEAQMRMTKLQGKLDSVDAAAPN